MQTTHRRVSHRRAIWIRPDANPRHHAAVLVFKNMTMIHEIARDREWDVNGHRMVRASAFTPIVDAGADTIGMSERHAVHQHALAKYLVRHAGLSEFSG